LAKRTFFYGWTVVGICTVAMTLGYGVRHSFSVFFPPILEEFGWNRGSTALMLSIHLLCYGIVSPFSGALSDHWKPKRTIILGAVILGISTAACGLAQELWHFYFVFGFLTPIGLACVGAPVVTPTIINWFSKSRGLAYGIAQMGGGLSFIYAIYAESMISLLGWRYAYLILGLTIMILLIPVIFAFYAGDPAEKGLKPYGYEEKEVGNDDPDSTQSETSDRDWTLRKALGTHQLWLMVISMTLYWGLGCYMVLAHQVKFAQDIGYSSIFAASIFGLYGLSMVAGQLSASISDRIGREVVLVTGCLLAILSIFALTQVRDTSNSWLLYVYALGFGYGSGLQAPTIFVGASDLFAGKHFGAINGMILAGMGIGGSLGPWLGGLLYDTFGSYHFAFGISMLSFALSAVAFVIAAPRRKIVFRPA